MSEFHRRPNRRIATFAAGLLAVSGLALTASATAPANAAETTTNVTFGDCEVREDPYGTNRRLQDNISWATTVRMNIPTPVRAGVEVTTEVEFGPLPADLLPLDLQGFEIDSDVSFATDESSDLNFRTYNVPYGEYDASAPFAMDELEVDTYWSEAGLYLHRPKEVYFELTGLDADDNYLEFTFACDNIVNPPELLTVAIYDPDASPSLLLDEYYVKQGGALGLIGEHLLGSAPTTPAPEATVTVGGIVIGSYPIDESGAIDVRIKVPAFTPAGSVQVRVSNGSRSATATLQVQAGKGKVKAAPKAASSGKKIKLTGSKFKPGEQVKLTLKGGRGKGTKSFTTTVKTKANGTFAKAVKLKKAAKGSWRVTATGSSSKRTARTSFKVR